MHQLLAGIACAQRTNAPAQGWDRVWPRAGTSKPMWAGVAWAEHEWHWPRLQAKIFFFFLLQAEVIPCPKGRGLVQPKILAVLGEFTGEENWSHHFWRRCFGWENIMERSWFNGDYGGERRKVKSQRFKNQNPRKIESNLSRNSDEIRSQGSSETSFWSSGTVTRGSRHFCRPKP